MAEPIAPGRKRPTTETRFPDAPAGAAATISHRVNAERLVLLGWGRAILMQLAHPLIAAGVYDHSSFRATPMAAASRLHGTVKAMLDLTFGTDAERQHALHGIRTIHKRVHGRIPEPIGPFPAGTAYSAEDPDLVLWVHVTLLESVPLVYELLVGPLTEEERDTYCGEAAWVAIALGARPQDVPRRFADVRGHLEKMYASGALVAGGRARELAGAVVAPRVGRIVPPAMSLHRLLTIGLLPAQIREQYGYAWGAADQRKLDRVVRLIRRLRQRLPLGLALWPEARD